MKIFNCSACGQAAHFDNTVCTACGASLGYVPERFEMLAFHENPPEGHHICANSNACGCNWLVQEKDNEPFCKACRLNLKVPNLSDPENVSLWTKLEAAKRHFLYGLMRLDMPIVSRKKDPDNGLAFQLLSEDGPEGPILTGHDNGLITINIAEADDPERESRKEALGENFRTLLGHFRHESGHYYWNMLIRDEENISDARKVFGDERENYVQALEAHYAEGPPADWQEHFITAYAASHSWEDFAETWAHYLHIIDGLETAYSYGIWPLSGKTEPFDAYANCTIESVLQAWINLSLAVNAVNRSVGQPDLYPFVFNEDVNRKLGFIHHLTRPGQREQ